MPRSRRQITSDAHAAGRLVDGADRPLRFEEIRNGLRAAGIDLTVKQARRTLELAERLGLVDRVNRSRWGRIGLGHLPPAARRSRAETVMEVAARLLELPPSAELHRAVRTVLRLAIDQAGRPVLSQQTRREASPVPTATTIPRTTSASKANGAQHEVDPAVEVLFDPHA